MAKAQSHGTSEKEGKAWGHGKFANMPTEVKMDMYPKGRMVGGMEDDTITGIDKLESEAVAKAGRYMSNQK